MKTFEILDANWDSNAWSPARLFQCETPTVPDIFRTLKVPSMILKTFDNIKKQVRDRLDQCRCFGVVDLINIFSKMSQKNVKKKYSANRTNKLLAESFRWKKHFARLPNFNEIPSNFESKLSPLSKLCKSRKSYPHNVRESLSLLFAWIIYRFFGLNVGPTDPERLWGQRKPWKICHSTIQNENGAGRRKGSDRCVCTHRRKFDFVVALQYSIIPLAAGTKHLSRHTPSPHHHGQLVSPLEDEPNANSWTLDTVGRTEARGGGW